MPSLLETYRLDRTKVEVVSLEDQGNDLEFWLSKSLNERIEAMELLRQINYGYDPATDRIQRILEFAQLEIR